jgi:hypothetical protein
MTNARENGRLKTQFQAVCFFPSWEIALNPTEIWEGSLEMSIQKM